MIVSNHLALYYKSYVTGTFLVSYLTIAIVFGVPLLFLEITLGQFCQQGTTKLWRAVPLLKGMGNFFFLPQRLSCRQSISIVIHRRQWCCIFLSIITVLLSGVGFVKILASVLLAAYYPIIMALSLFYGTRSVVGGIPFPECSSSVNFFVSTTLYNCNHRPARFASQKVSFQ